MSRRRRLALLGYAVLVLFLLVAPTRPRELARRVRLLAHDANRDPALRRLDGSSAAFDRRFFYFLESARRRLPAGAAGVAFYEPSPRMPSRVLALYQFAPLPVRIAPREEEVPPGWVLAVYGPWRPAGWREIAKVSDGALLEREP
jgi:hypothetical protein